MNKLGRSLHVVLVMGILGAAAAAAAPASAHPVMVNLMKRVDQVMGARNGVALEKLLGVVGVMGPEEFTDWEKIAEAGAAAAKRGDFNATKKSCTECHDRYRDQYKAKSGGYKGPKPE